MKSWSAVLIVALLSARVFFPCSAWCQGMSKEEIRKELKALKERIQVLEEALTQKEQKIKKIEKETVKRDDMPKVIEEMKAAGGPLQYLQEHIRLSGLLEFGGVWARTDMRKGGHTRQSDLNLTTAQLGVDAVLADWINGGIIFKYEDPTFAAGIDESGVRLDVGMITLGNPNKFPLYGSGGAFYVPFGALLTHFPDKPLVDEPLTLILGQTRAKAALLGLDYAGLLLSGYVFNGDMQKIGDENKIRSFGFDARYRFERQKGFKGMIGASYISNLATSDGLTEFLHKKGIHEIEDYVGGFDAYVSLSYSNFFLDMEYMTALKAFAPNEIATWAGHGARPMVWNVEAGYNYNWGRDLEIVLKYSGSNQTEDLGYPKARYGIGLNQAIYSGLIASLGYFHDQFDSQDREGRDSRDMVFGQISLEF